MGYPWRSRRIAAAAAALAPERVQTGLGRPLYTSSSTRSLGGTDAAHHQRGGAHTEPEVRFNRAIPVGCIVFFIDTLLRGEDGR
jgi:hypothetical protein